jgi:hypothetical protein
MVWISLVEPDWQYTDSRVYVGLDGKLYINLAPA